MGSLSNDTRREASSHPIPNLNQTSTLRWQPASRVLCEASSQTQTVKHPEVSFIEPTQEAPNKGNKEKESRRRDRAPTGIPKLLQDACRKHPKEEPRTLLRAVC